MTIYVLLNWWFAELAVRKELDEMIAVDDNDVWQPLKSRASVQISVVLRQGRFNLKTFYFYSTKDFLMEGSEKILSVRIL